MMKVFTYLLLLSGIILVQSCKVGPNYLQPEEKTSKEFRYSAKNTDSIINLKWWDLFKDPVLDTLIVTALRENKDALIAASRIEQARANVSFTKADMGPKITVNAGASRGDLVNGTLQLNAPINTFSASTGINWELDFWGKFRRGNEAAQANLLATFYGKRALEIALISEVANNYFQLIDYKSRLEISQNTLALRDSTLQIIQARFNEGYTNIIDVNQAQIQKAITQVSIPQFKRSIAFTEHNLSILLGRTPDSIPSLKKLRDYEIPEIIPTGIPSEILQRRPDILEAQEYYRASNAYIGVAQAMRFPTISLTGLLGLGSSDLSNLVSNGLGWTAGAGLGAPLFEWGKNKKRVDIERENAYQSLLFYENTVLNALLEVDNSLIELSTLKEELNANKLMLDAATNASYLSRERYYQGVTSYLEVIENQRVEFDARLAYTENYQRLLTSYVFLYKSLGGGWISSQEIDKYAQQLADEQGVDVSTIDKNDLFYNGQIVDLYLTKEEKQAKKEKKKAQRRSEKEQRKNARKNI
ncbi:MAG: efflux transporter outer membrane subunit [Flavobacteriaceae bacterium]|nr:efflux transporter outer membrane subunit [Flavobacteriaceae bacterium]MDG1790450.1 efflux transporter outer membrane subunit [Flavobacteriaceae bacterium]MDG2446284.1 efflux transporter outer membrane subunit [Flavobacteriaceae bacterium]